MVIRYHHDPDSYFTLVDYCIRSGIDVADFRCERPWKTLGKQGDLFACADSAPSYGQREVAISPGAGADLAIRLARSAPGSGRRLLDAFLSEDPLESSAIAYARIALRGDKARLDDESDHAVRTILRAARRVRKEINAFLGLLRFEESPSGVYEAVFEPDADISRALFPFFRARFCEIPFSILDAKRGIRIGSGEAAVSSGRPDAGENPLWKDLWKTFYDSTENQRRANPTLRLQHIPRRYWKHLPELEDKA